MLARGTERELVAPNRSRARMMESYTVPEAAQALGRSVSNFRRWLETEIIPAPVLSDTSRAHACYCAGELEIIAEELREHERNFVSLCASHTATILRISQRLHGFRATEFEQGHTRTR